MSSFVASTLLLLLGLSSQVSSFWPPEQIHINLGKTPDVMFFNWLTFDCCPIQAQTVVMAGDVSENPSTFTMNVTGEAHLFTDPGSEHINRTIHSAKVTHLKASTLYYYQVGDPYQGWSPVFHFKTAPDAKTLESVLPHTMIIYGDMGTTNTQSCAPVTQDILRNDVDFVLHVGDFAYNMYENNGTTGDQFMRDITPIATSVPYMTCPGNHEAKYNFSHYTQRFRGQPQIDHAADDNQYGAATVWTGTGELPNNWYYSWNYGLIHFIALSSEIYFTFPYLIPEQYNWLVRDLEIANTNRTLAPWVIIYHHRLLYCSATGSECGSQPEVMRDGVFVNGSKTKSYGLEDVYYKYGVDFVYNGHVHNYERMYDVYKNTTTKTTKNMPSTTFIANGDAGNREGHHTFNTYQPAWSAYRTTTYSYSRFQVHNATHIHLRQILADNELPPTEQGSVIDDVWFVQHKHGPFGENYPNRVMSDENRNVPGITYDPYAEYGIPMKVESEEEREKYSHPIPFISGNKEDYRGVDGVYF